MARPGVDMLSSASHSSNSQQSRLTLRKQCSDDSDNVGRAEQSWEPPMVSTAPEQGGIKQVVSRVTAL